MACEKVHCEIFLEEIVNKGTKEEMLGICVNWRLEWVIGG